MRYKNLVTFLNIQDKEIETKTKKTKSSNTKERQERSNSVHVQANKKLIMGIFIPIKIRFLLQSVISIQIRNMLVVRLMPI